MTDNIDQPDGDDSQLAGRLDEYLTRLQLGDADGCRAILQATPELLEFAASLQALDSLSPDLEFASSLLDALNHASVQTSPGDNGREDGLDVTAGPERDDSGGPVDETVVLPSRLKSPGQETRSEDCAVRTVSGDTRSADATAPHRLFGRFELLEELGRGGMGVVYRARQTDLNRVVAVKMILVNRLASRADIARFYQEAQAAGRLTHPNIVAIHEVGEVHGQPYFSMDCIDGLSLSTVLSRGAATPEWPGAGSRAGSDGRPEPEREAGSDWSAGVGQAGNDHSSTRGRSQEQAAPAWATRSAQARRLTFDELARLLRDVARATAYLHDNGIVHRDLKPSNILIGRNGQPYVTDFGLARVSAPDSQRTDSGTIVGTPNYMSPEQAAGRLDVISPASDIYSLGVILYEGASGKLPHQASNVMETLVRVMEQEPDPPRIHNREVPRELEAICLKCLEKNPSDRYATATELAVELDRFLRGEPVEAGSIGIYHALRRWMRRDTALASRWTAMLAGSLILFVSTQLGQITAPTHASFQILLACWAAAAFLFHRMQRGESTRHLARFAWMAGDAAFLTRMLVLASSPTGALLVVYPLLIAASGLFLQEGLVLFMTTVSLISYAAFLFLRPEEAWPQHYPVLFAAILLLVGVVISHQVRRLRVLSRHFEQG